MSRFGDLVRKAVMAPQAGPFGGSTSDGLVITTFTPSAVDFVRLGDSVSTLHAIYRKQYAVRTCVNFLATNMAHLKLKTYRRVSDTEREYVPDHPLSRLLVKPNGRTSSFDLIRDLVSDLAIYMNSYWWKATSGGARALVRLPPALVTPIGGDPLVGAAQYELTTAGGPRRIDAADIVHVRGYDPLDARQGMPILWALKAILAEEDAASRHRTGFWRNAARRDGVIQRPADAPPWTKDQREQFREGWHAAHAGADNAGKAPVLEDGMIWNPDTFSPKESEFIAGRQWSLDTVATAYQIPLAMLSRTNTATFASVKEFHTVLYVDVLGSWAAWIESALALQLVPDYNDPDLYVEFNIDEKLQGDFEGTADAMRSSIQVPWLSVNDGRALRNMPRIDDPDFDVPAKPTNYAYGEESAPAPAPVQLAPAAGNGHVDIEAELEQLTRIVEAHDD